MALSYSFPGPTTLATTTDGRKDLAGLVETDTSYGARPGIFPAHQNALVTARTDMNVDVQVFQACAVQFGGAIFFANDGVAQLGSVLVSPASGNNYYVVYAKQNESTAPGTDANNNRILSATLSTASFAAARATLPTGAVELATVLMPTGKTATNQSGVTITATHQFTTSEGSPVWLRNATEQAAWSPADGSLGWRLDVAQYVERVSGAWATRGGSCRVRTSTAQATSASILTPAAITWNVEDFDTDNFHDNVTNPSRLIAPVAGYYQVNAKIRTGSTAYASGLQIGVNGTVDAASRVLVPPYAGSGIGAFATVEGRYKLNAGDYLEVFSIGEAASLSLTIAECYAEIQRVG